MWVRPSKGVSTSPKYVDTPPKDVGTPPKDVDMRLQKIAYNICGHSQHLYSLYFDQSHCDLLT